MVKKERNAPRFGVPIAHIIGNQPKDLRRFFGDLLGIAARVQAFGRVEHVAQPARFLGIAGDFIMAKGINALLGIGEIGVDFPMVDIGNDQERRVVQVFAVFEQLLVSGVEVFVFVGRLVFNGKMPFKIDIGKSVSANLL